MGVYKTNKHTFWILLRANKTFFLRRCKLFSQNLSQHTVSTNNKLKGSLKINAITATNGTLLRQTVRATICWGRTSDSVGFSFACLLYVKWPVAAQQSSKTVCLFTRLAKYYKVGAGDLALDVTQLFRVPNPSN